MFIGIEVKKALSKEEQLKKLEHWVSSCIHEPGEYELPEHVVPARQIQIKPYFGKEPAVLSDIKFSGIIRHVTDHYEVQIPRPVAEKLVKERKAMSVYQYLLVWDIDTYLSDEEIDEQEIELVQSAKKWESLVAVSIIGNARSPFHMLQDVWKSDRPDNLRRKLETALIQENAFFNIA